MYTNLGYIIYRTILEYYSGDQDEDAYGKAQSSYPFPFPAPPWLIFHLSTFLQT